MADTRLQRVIALGRLRQAREGRPEHREYAAAMAQLIAELERDLAHAAHR